MRQSCNAPQECMHFTPPQCYRILCESAFHYIEQSGTTPKKPIEVSELSKSSGSPLFAGWWNWIRSPKGLSRRHWRVNDLVDNLFAPSSLRNARYSCEWESYVCDICDISQNSLFQQINKFVESLLFQGTLLPLQLWLNSSICISGQCFHVNIQGITWPMVLHFLGDGFCDGQVVHNTSVAACFATFSVTKFSLLYQALRQFFHCSPVSHVHFVLLAKDTGIKGQWCVAPPSAAPKGVSFTFLTNFLFEFELLARCFLPEQLTDTGLLISPRSSDFLCWHQS